MWARLGGLLKYYRREIKSTGKGDDLKGQVGICGLSIMCADDHSRRYTLKSPSEKEGRELEFENDQQVSPALRAPCPATPLIVVCLLCVVC